MIPMIKVKNDAVIIMVIKIRVAPILIIQISVIKRREAVIKPHYKSFEVPMYFMKSQFGCSASYDQNCSDAMQDLLNQPVHPLL